MADPSPPPTFLSQVESSLPQGMALPPEFRTAISWMEANGCVHKYRSTDGRYASVYPHQQGLTHIYFKPVDPGHADAWGGISKEASTRLAPILRTGGDGTYIALWRDDRDVLQSVYLGSGSGSTLMCLAARSPLDVLRLMAIGYEELCWPETLAQTPAQIAAASDYSDGAPPVPEAFRAFVTSTFATAIPRTASEIAPAVAEMGDAQSGDPFWRWMKNEQQKLHGAKCTFRAGDSATKPYLFDEAGIMAFAYGAGDMNVLHHDPEAAAKTRFKGIIASGAQMTAVLMGFGASTLSERHEAVGLEFNTRFECAIPAGTQTTLTVTITSCEPHAKLGGSLVTFEGAITGDDGKRYVSATGKAVLWDDPLA